MDQLAKKPSLMKRLLSAWSRHGAGGFLQLIGKNISYYSGELLSGRLFRKSEGGISEFDRAYGAETEGIREVGSLDIESENARHAVRYQPSPHGVASKILHGLPIDHRQYTFLDFGAGKGRLLLIAAEFPFQAVIGIEFSRELCEVAKNNIDSIAADMRVASRIECQHADVTAFPLPDTPLVCYFYNPFDAVIMQVVVDRLATSLKRVPREVYVVYVHPEHRALFEAVGRWQLIEEDEFHVVYRVRQSRLPRTP